MLENVIKSYHKEVSSETPKWLLCGIFKKTIGVVENAVVEAAAAHSLNSVVSQTSLLPDLGMI